MLFRSKDLTAIMEGRVTTAFRRWRKPTVKPGGTIRTQMGMVTIDAVDVIDPAALTEVDAAAANFPSLAALNGMFEAQEGVCYRIRLHPGGADPREALRADDQLSTQDHAKIAAKLERLDKNAGSAWTLSTLRMIEAMPGTVSTTLAAKLSWERFAFKDNVSKLKRLGLTISLSTGYRLSPRGEAYLRALPNGD